jgi:signal transduction histidine kinase
MNGFIDNLLTLAKIESQESISNIEMINISQIVEHSIQMHKNIYQDKGIEVIPHITD